MEQKTKKTGKKLWLLIPLAVLLVLGGYMAFRFFCPSPKDLLVLAHYNTVQDSEKEEKTDLFYKVTDASCRMEGAFTEQKIMENIGTMGIHCENARLAEHSGFFRFAFRIGERDVLTTESVSYGGKSYVASKELTDGQYYGGETPQVILNLLLGGQGIQTDVGLLDGVDKEVFMDYVKHYGTQLYQSLPDSAFTRTETENGTTLKLSGNAAWLLTDVVSQIRQDYGLKHFLYLQREKIAENIHTTYRGATLLMPSMTRAEFEADYDEALDGFLTDIAEKGTVLELVTQIDKNRRVVSDSLTLKNGEVFVLELSADKSGSYRFIPYQDGTPIYALENTQKTEGTITDAALTFSMDINDLTKTPSETEAKMMYLTVVSRKDTNITPYKAEAPEQAVFLSELGEEETAALKEKADSRLADVLMEIMLNALATD